MIILHIIIGLNVGGAEKSLSYLVSPERPDNFSKKSIIISLTTLGKIGLELSRQNITIHTLNMGNLRRFPFALFKLFGLIKTYNPDIIQTWMYHANLIGGCIARLAGYKNIIWGIRSTHPPQGNARTYCIMKLGGLLSHHIPRKIVCVAEAARQTHIKHGYAAKKMLVISNGFDPKHFHSNIHRQKSHIRRHLNINTNAPIIGCVGRYHFDKGQDTLVSAAYQVIAIHPHVCFMLVGHNCDLSNLNLMEQINTLGLQSNFYLLGERENVPYYLAAMDIFCMPSRTEGFPNGLGEAMVVGLPCVATRVGDTERLAGNTVKLVASENPLELANTLLELLSMPTEARWNMGQHASQRIQRKFSIQAMREKYQALYKDLIGYQS